MQTQRLGRYELYRHLATGGMADVSLARISGPEGFEKLCVVKTLLPDLARDERYRAMFLNEARVAARLQHSNVVQIFDVGVVDGRYYMAMEYLHGRDLGQLMVLTRKAGQRLPLETALHVIVSACAGLHFAHEQRSPEGALLNLVHRDVSPRNVFVGFDGHVKVLDFGIVKTLDSSHKTRTGVLKGTVGYMSPEQVRGQPVDRRSDVFGLSILLWELVTGERLYRTADEYSAMRKVVEEDAPPPSSCFADCPAELDAILKQGLARDPAGRFESAAQLQQALEAFARGRGLTVSASAVARSMEDYFPGASDLRTLNPSEAEADVTACEVPEPKWRVSASATPPVGSRRRTVAVVAVLATLALALVVSLGVWGGSRAESSTAQAPVVTAAVPPPARADTSGQPQERVRSEPGTETAEPAGEKAIASLPAPATTPRINEAPKTESAPAPAVRAKTSRTRKRPKSPRAPAAEPPEEKPFDHDSPLLP